MEEEGRGGGSFLDGCATPGIVESNDDYEDDDPKWRASVILHELDWLELLSLGAVGAKGGGGGVGVGGVNTAPPLSSSSSSSSFSPRSSLSSVPWLEALTRVRCLDVL